MGQITLKSASLERIQGSELSSFSCMEWLKRAGLKVSLNAPAYMSASRCDILRRTQDNFCGILEGMHNLNLIMRNHHAN